MSITTLIESLNETKIKITKTQQYLTELKKNRDDLEKSIITFLEIHNLPGFKHDGKIYQPKTSKIYKKRKKNEKEDTIKHILNKSGIHANNEMVTDLFKVFKHNSISTQRLTVNSKFN